MEEALKVGDIVWHSDKTIGGVPEQVKLIQKHPTMPEFFQFEDMKGVVNIYFNSSVHFFRTEKECLESCIRAATHWQKYYQEGVDCLMEEVKEKKGTVSYCKRQQLKMEKKLKNLSEVK